MVSRFSIRRWYCLAALCVAALASGPAHAAQWLASPDCSASGNSLDCRLAGVLSFLYIAAAVLAFALLLVVLLAVRSFRQRSRSDKGRP